MAAQDPPIIAAMAYFWLGETPTTYDITGYGISSTLLLYAIAAVLGSLSPVLLLPIL